MSKTHWLWASLVMGALVLTGCSKNLNQLRAEHVEEETQA